MAETFKAGSTFEQPFVTFLDASMRMLFVNTRSWVNIGDTRVMTRPAYNAAIARLRRQQGVTVRFTGHGDGVIGDCSVTFRDVASYNAAKTEIVEACYTGDDRIRRHRALDHANRVTAKARANAYAEWLALNR